MPACDVSLGPGVVASCRRSPRTPERGDRETARTYGGGMEASRSLHRSVLGEHGVRPSRSHAPRFRSSGLRAASARRAKMPRRSPRRRCCARSEHAAWHPARARVASLALDGGAEPVDRRAPPPRAAPRHGGRVDRSHPGTERAARAGCRDAPRRRGRSARRWRSCRRRSERRSTSASSAGSATRRSAQRARHDDERGDRDPATRPRDHQAPPRRNRTRALGARGHAAGAAAPRCPRRAARRRAGRRREDRRPGHARGRRRGRGRARSDGARDGAPRAGRGCGARDRSRVAGQHAGAPRWRAGRRLPPPRAPHAAAGDTRAGPRSRSTRSSGWISEAHPGADLCGRGCRHPSRNRDAGRSRAGHRNAGQPRGRRGAPAQEHQARPGLALREPPARFARTVARGHVRGAPRSTGRRGGRFRKRSRARLGGARYREGRSKRRDEPGRARNAALLQTGRPNGQRRGSGCDRHRRAYERPRRRRPPRPHRPARRTPTRRAPPTARRRPRAGAGGSAHREHEGRARGARQRRAPGRAAANWPACTIANEVAKRPGGVGANAADAPPAGAP